MCYKMNLLGSSQFKYNNQNEIDVKNFKVAFRKAFIKNLLVISGVLLLASAWLIEKSLVQAKQSEVESKRLLWEQYRSDNAIYAVITSKFETMRLVDLESTGIPKDSSIRNKILLQLRFALFDHLSLRIATEEAVYLLEKDPLDEETVKKLNNKKVEAANALNSGDISKLFLLHERENNSSFNEIELRTKQYVKEYNTLIEKGRRYESIFLVMYILGSVLVVSQRIKDSIVKEQEEVVEKDTKKLQKRK